MNSHIVALMLAVICFSIFANAQSNNPGKPIMINEQDEIDKVILHSFEHFDYLDILYKLKGHNDDTWIVLFYVDEDHHKYERDRVKALIFKDNPTFKYAEVNISEPNYAPIKQAIKFPQNTNERDFPMVLIMKNQKGKMAYGPGAPKMAADIIADMKKEEEEKAKAEAAAATKKR